MARIVIIGSGPAGMSAAIEARKHGAEVQVYDNRPEPGGNVFAGLETTRKHRPEVWSALGSSYADGAALVDAFRASGAKCSQQTSLWHLEQEGTMALRGPNGTAMDAADAVVLATGAQERPMPLPGWTLPGVMGVGAAQILLKTSGTLPDGPVVIVGNGPLPLLYAWQFARMGGRIAGFIEPEGTGPTARALLNIKGALAGQSYITKGLWYQLDRLRRRIPVYRNARDIAIIGEKDAQGVRFSANGTHEIEARSVLLHDGVIPTVHAASAAGLPLSFDATTQTWFAGSAGNIQIAGDAGGILGAKAAILSGREAAQAALGKSGAGASDKLARERTFRQFIDAVYPPSNLAENAADDTTICRCELVTAGAIRAAASELVHDPNRLKSTLRVGMGPCQGRMCAQSLQAVVARQSQIPREEIGLHRLRSPITPITLGDLAGLKE